MGLNCLYSSIRWATFPYLQVCLPKVGVVVLFLLKIHSSKDTVCSLESLMSTNRHYFERRWHKGHYLGGKWKGRSLVRLSQ